jgi:ABC-2 type transport system permease protein
VNAVIALAVKDLRLLLRVKAGLFFTFIWPLLVAVGFGAILGGDSGQRSAIGVAVTDEDRSAGSRAFIDALGKGGELELHPATRAEGLDAVRRGRETAAIVLEPGFGAASERMFYGTPPRVLLGIDPARRAESGMLEGILMKHGAARMQRMFEDPGMSRASVARARQSLPPQGASARSDSVRKFLGALDEYLEEGTPPAPAPAGGAAPARGGWQPLVIEKTGVTVQRQGPPSAYAFTFPQGVIWGILGCVMSFAIGLVVERSRGTLVRLQAAPLGRAHILGGKALACFAAVLVLEVLLYTLGVVVFDIGVPSPARLAAAMLSIGVAFVGLMMIVAAIGKNEQTTAAAGWGLMMPLAMLGGAMIPLFIMPPWLVRLSALSPVKWAILALEGATWRQFGWGELLTPCAVLLAVGAASFAVGTRLVRTT